MIHNVIIRSYLKSDRNECLKLFDLNCPRFFSRNERSSMELWLNGQDKGTITYKSSMADFYYVALHNYEVVGCEGFYIVSNQPAARLTWSVINPENQSQGLGTKLVSHCINQIESLFPSYRIELDTSQHTFAFFEKFGFQKTQITENGYGPGLHRYDMIKNAQTTIS